MSFNTSELTEALSENHERVFDEHTHVMVDDVDDFSELFREVRDAIGRDFQIQIENRPDTAYIHPPREEEF